MRCSKCGTDNREARKFCAECGASFLMSAKCPRCGAANEPGEKFCGECGASLAVGASGSTAPPAAEGSDLVRPDRSRSHINFAERMRVQAGADTPIDGERKTVTALFADIKARWS